MNKNTNYSKEDKIRLKKIIKSLDKDIKRLKIRRKNYKKQLTLTDVGCSKISDEQKQKAYDSAIKLVNEIFDW